MKTTSATVLVCTYNRASLLRETLAAFTAMTPQSTATSRSSSWTTTRRITPRVWSPTRPARSPYRIVSLPRERQGKSFALNRGLEARRATSSP
jgi:hypothetical protein